MRTVKDLSSERALYQTERDHIEYIIPLWDEDVSIAGIKLKDTTYRFKKPPFCELQEPDNIWMFCNIDMESDTSIPLGENINLDNIRIRTIAKKGEENIYRIYIKPADK